MKKIFMLSCGVSLLVVSVSFAARVYLKDGRKVEGDIIAHTKYSTKVMVGAEEKTFYADEVSRVEGLDEDDNMLSESYSAVSEDKKELIIKLLEVNGALEGMKAALTSLVGQLSPEKRAEFETFLNVQGFVDVFVPIYGKYYSKQELTEMIAFYSSPTGQHVLEVTPEIMQESIKAAVQYFREMEAEDD